MCTVELSRNDTILQCTYFEVSYTYQFLLILAILSFLKFSLFFCPYFLFLFLFLSLSLSLLLAIISIINYRKYISLKHADLLTHFIFLKCLLVWRKIDFKSFYKSISLYLSLSLFLSIFISVYFSLYLFLTPYRPSIYLSI